MNTNDYMNYIPICAFCDAKKLVKFAHDDASQKADRYVKTLNEMEKLNNKFKERSMK